MSAAADLAAFAATLDLGLGGGSIFSEVEPKDTVDPAVTFKGYGSGITQKVYDDRRPAVTTPRVQVTVRTRNRFSAAQRVAEALYDGLFRYNTVLNGNRYTLVEPMSEPIPIGPDANNRLQLSFNVLTRRLST